MAAPTAATVRTRTALELPASDAQLREWIRTRVKEEFQDELFIFFKNEESVVIDNMFEWSESWHQARMRQMLFFLQVDPKHWEWSSKKGRDEARKKANEVVHRPNIAVDCLVNESRQWKSWIETDNIFENVYQMRREDARRIRDMATSFDQAIPEDIKAAFAWSLQFIDRYLDWKQNVCQQEGKLYRNSSYNPDTSVPLPPRHHRNESDWMPSLAARLQEYEARFRVFLNRLEEILAEAEQPATNADGEATRGIEPATWDGFDLAVQAIVERVRQSNLRQVYIPAEDMPIWPASQGASDFTAKPPRPVSACRPKKRRRGAEETGDDSTTGGGKRRS
ncbi:hypothetical protein PFICI_15353 [Pestalotiopsis fici W106-1]|uniref:Uncharacterized protein n=1 Tax=Pestalotiopsis fici (strain W106-1 / CGMCC3.15140) TaxID=1229662 RepID=W3WJI0_PESFW|nr:uncharacterized protein PFICI_15353 [Pestalotiopsis fici W106-1]ETS72961.1 hypothetical protein PFICI_15353 [Pestalotiopsis fici W106-1]